MIKYKAGKTCWKTLVEAVDVEGETDKFIKLKNGRRECKRSDYANWFDTFAEAKKFLVDSVSREIDGLKIRLDGANNDFWRIKNLEEEDAVQAEMGSAPQKTLKL